MTTSGQDKNVAVTSGMIVTMTPYTNIPSTAFSDY